jgi:hypothetical protein
MGERSFSPVAGTKNDGDHAGFSFVLEFEGSGIIDVVTVVGCEEGGAQEEKDDVGSFQALIDGGVERIACSNTAILPRFDLPVALHHGEVFLEFVAECFVFVGIGKKYGSPGEIDLGLHLKPGDHG